MPVIVGLGNPGEKYRNTRHNIGFDIVEEFASAYSWQWKKGKGKYELAAGLVDGRKVLLVKPQTYMNLSGQAVQHCLAFFKEKLSDLLVCTDDINLPVAKLRIKPGGSAGGHNGIGHIIETLGTNNFPRLRFGVGNDFYIGDQANYVLSPFDLKDKNIVAESTTQAVKAVECFVREGINKTMNLYN